MNANASMTKIRRLGAPAALALAAVFATAGCSNNGGGNDTVAVNGDVPIAYAQRSASIEIDPWASLTENGRLRTVRSISRHARSPPTPPSSTKTRSRR